MLPSKVRRALACLFTVSSLVFVFSLSAAAQSTGGRILGRVADPSGAVLSGVKIMIVNEATGVTRETVTNENGDYVFPEVAVGTYRAEFDQKGFKKNIRRAVQLDINQVRSEERRVGKESREERA